MIHITLEVDNGNIDAYVGEAGERLSIGSFYVTPFEVGLIGFRQGWGEEAEFDNIVVKDAAGDILYSEDFEKDRVNFSGGSITEDKTLLVSEGVFHYVNRAAQNTYTIESTLIPNQGGGIVFGAADENNLYWWQLDVGRLLLKPMRMVDGIWQQDFANGAQTDLSPYLTNEKLGQPIALRLEVVDDTVKTYIDETLVATTTITPALIGRVGIYHEAGYNALYDSLFVYDVEGKAVYAETFDDGAETIFSPAFVTVENSNLVWGEGLLLTATDRYREAAPMVRKEFSTKSGISSARLYATALGIYDFYMNGQKVTDTYFNPGNTAYPERVQYQTYDVTELIVEGSNAIGAFIGHGWYDRAAGIARKHKPWGDTLALQAKLVIQYTDGSTETIVTDETWKYYGNGPIRDNDFYNGEVYDANREVPGWDRAGFDDAKWTPVATYTSEELNAGTITAKEDPHVKNIEILKPISVTEPVDNVFVYDFGQNFAGIVRLKVTGEQGQKIILQHGEEINAENLRNKDGETGTVWRVSNGEALATDEYVLKGDPNGEIFEPSFVFHGFRYMQILGLEEAIPIEDVEGLVLMTDLEETSSFESSDSAVNQLYSNALWSQRSNFIDIPTDCPQRAERLGYTGDAQIYARTASYYMNTLPFMEKFLRDVRDVQREDGAYSDMAPLCWDSNYGTNGWGDGGVIIPYQLYMQYGDTRVIEENYDAMCRYIDYLVSTSTDYVRTVQQLGDWLSLEDTPTSLTNTAYCAYSSRLLSIMAEAIGKDEDAARFLQISENYKAAWNREFVLEENCGRRQRRNW